MEPLSTPAGLRVSLTDLRHTEGARLDFHAAGTLPAATGTGLVHWPADRAATVDGVLESVGEGVLVTGTVAVDLDITCGRCLKESTTAIAADIRELFVYPGHDDEYAEADVSHVDGTSLDLAPVVRDAILLDAPLHPLCTPDCAGLCPRCGADLNEAPDHAHDDDTDSRWSGLAGWGRMS